MFNTWISLFVSCAMFVLNYVFLSLVFIESCLSISAGEENGPAEILWNLSKLALQSRQHIKDPYSYKYPGKYPQYYQNYPVNSYTSYPGSTYPNSHNKRPNFYTQKYHHPHDYIPNPTSYPSRPLGAKLQQSFMEILFSIAKNDDLQCVPKIICEVTSGTISGRQQAQNLPININMESLLGFLSALGGLQTSPLFYFGKAALQGYSSKGNTGSCSSTYPECPSDPDKLVNYLNNHNGGFFRYFNGVNPESYAVPGSQYSPLYLRPKATAEQRIQNSPVNYVGNTFRDQKEIKFPIRDEFSNFQDERPNFQQTKLTFPSINSDDDLKLNSDSFFLYKSQNLLKFPEEKTKVNYDEQPFRKPKKLPYDLSYYFENDLDLQKPLPNHQASPVIFPVRTGTGELRLDAEELSNSKPLLYEDDNVKITFNRFNRDGNEDFRSNYLSSTGRGFAFPSR